MTLSTPRLDAMRWLCQELYADFAHTVDYSLVEEFTNSLSAFDGEIILHNLFWRALENGRLDIAGICLVHDASLVSPASSDAGPLHEVMRQYGDRSDLIEWLIDHGADSDRRDPVYANVTPLEEAVSLGHEKTAELLLRVKQGRNKH